MATRKIGTGKCKGLRGDSLKACMKRNSKTNKSRWYADTGKGLETKRNYFKSEQAAKSFVVRKAKQGERTGYRNESSDLNTEWKGWWMKGDSTGRLQKRIFDDELDARRFIEKRKKEGLLVGLNAQQKGMGLDN